VWSDGAVDIGSGTVAVVTGAGSGIGAALAAAFRATGARVALADVDGDGLERTAAALPGAADGVLTRVTDVSDRSAVAALADATVDRYGHVDVVVNNAGIALDGARIDQLTPEQIAIVMDVNFWGVVHGTQVFLPHLGPPTAGRGRQPLVDLRHHRDGLAVRLRRQQVRRARLHRGAADGAGARRAARQCGRRTPRRDPDRHRARQSPHRGAPDHVARRELALFQAGLRLSPQAAAGTILDGLRRDRSRILVGGDATAGDRLARLLPVGYTRLFLRRLTRAGFFADEPPVGG
jgi:hypothetical protein